MLIAVFNSLLTLLIFSCRCAVLRLRCILGDFLFCVIQRKVTLLYSCKNDCCFVGRTNDVSLVNETMFIKHLVQLWYCIYPIWTGILQQIQCNKNKSNKYLNAPILFCWIICLEKCSPQTLLHWTSCFRSTQRYGA